MPTSGRSLRYNIIYSRIIVDDALKLLIKTIKAGGPEAKELAMALGKVETGINAGLGTALGMQRLITSTSMLGKIAGLFAVSSELAAILQMVWSFLQLSAPEYEAAAPPGSRSIYRGGSIPIMKKKVTSVVVVEEQPAWRQIPFAGSGTP